MTSKLIAGDEAILKFVREIYHIDHPIICIWETNENPEVWEKTDPATNLIAVDVVKFYNKEHFHSLFFPNGFVKDEYNLVVAGIKDDEPDIVHVPMNGIIRGWIIGTDIEKLTIDMNLDT